MGYLTQEQLQNMGFAALGKSVLISEKASIYNPAKIRVGDHTRIDDFCIISAGEGGIQFGSHVHIACYVSLIGSGTIDIGDFAGISARTSVYSSNDDYSGAALTGPTVPEKYRNVAIAPVHIGRHVIVGAGCVILPGIHIGDGVAIGSMSLVNKNLEANFIYTGIPAQKKKARLLNYLELEKEFYKDSE